MAKPRTKSFTDEVPSISTREIVASLKESRAWPRYSSGGWDGLKSLRDGVSVRRIGEGVVSVYVATRENPVAQETRLSLSVVPAGLGGYRALVKCPCCARVRVRFYLHGGKVSCRECLKLTYRSKNLTSTQRRAMWQARFPTGRPSMMHRSTWARYEKRVGVA